VRLGGDPAPGPYLTYQSDYDSGRDTGACISAPVGAYSPLMASRPLESFVKQQIEAQGGWDACVFERIEAGETQTDVAHSFGVSQGWLSRLIHKDPDLTQRFNAARRSRARVYAEEAKTLADTVPADRDAIAKVREQIGVRRWLAAVDDRDTFGEQQPQVNVQVNVEGMHLDSLRHRMVDASVPLAVALKQTGHLALMSGNTAADSSADSSSGDSDGVHANGARGMTGVATPPCLDGGGVS